jgi:hypothetical protein
MRGLVTAVVLLAAASLGAHDPITTKVTWEREIAPIVQARCVSCHTAGGRAPMPLTTYEEVRPWARAIREEVLTRRMPKWHVVRGYGDFANDPSLSPFEIALFAAWADGGAPAAAKRPSATGSVPLRATSSGPASMPTLLTPAVAPVRNVTIPCASQTLPAGRLLAVKPVAPAGVSMKLTVRAPDASEEPLLWVRDFDPGFAETYWLRNPLVTTRGSRLVVDAPAAIAGKCAITVTVAR